MRSTRRAARTTLVYRSRSHSLALPLAHLSLSGARAKRVDKHNVRADGRKKSQRWRWRWRRRREEPCCTLSLLLILIYTLLYLNERESRAGGRVVVDVVARPDWPLGSEETLGDDNRSHFHQQTGTRRDQSENLRVLSPAKRSSSGYFDTLSVDIPCREQRSFFAKATK